MWTGFKHGILDRMQMPVALLNTSISAAPLFSICL